MKDSDGIERSIVLRAPRSRVWRALTSPHEFAQWFGVTFEGSFEAGARIAMTSTIDEYAGEKFEITIERMEPERVFAWRWHPGAQRPEIDYSKEPTTLVVFTLEDHPEGTRLTIVESGFSRISPERRAIVLGENTKGWEEQTESLARHVGQA